MKKTLCLFISLVLFTALNISASIRIVTTTTDLASITKEIGGDLVDVSGIATGYEDPHHVTAKPSYILKANKADLWITVGMDLEVGWEPLILAGSRNSDIQVGSAGYLDCSATITKLEIPTVIDRSLGDVHPAGNPHYWLDPYNGRLAAYEIMERLCRLEPAKSDVFRKNYESFKNRLDEKMFGKTLLSAAGGDDLWNMSNNRTLDEYCVKNNIHPDAGSWYGMMKNLHGRKFIAYHKLWIYFNTRFGLESVDFLEPKPGIPPTPSHLARIIDVVKNNGIKLLVQSVYNNPQASEFMHEKTGITVLTLPTSVGGTPEAKTYLDLFDVITNSFVSAFSMEGK